MTKTDDKTKTCCGNCEADTTATQEVTTPITTDEPESTPLDIRKNYPNLYKEMLIDQWIPNSRYRQMMLRYWCNEDTYESIAEEFDYSVNQVHNIVRECKKQVEKHISSPYNEKLFDRLCHIH